MENQSKDQIIEALEKLANKLGVKAELLFSFYVKEAKLYKYKLFIELFATAVFFAVALIAFFFLKENIDTDGIRFYLFVGSIISLIVTGIMLLWNFFALSDLLTAIKNPEYVAISEIMSTLTNSSE